ncbi:hypothetical protein TrRE_jg9559, partial [Triparma retinervis]
STSHLSTSRSRCRIYNPHYSGNLYTDKSHPHCGPFKTCHLLGDSGT